MCLTEAPVFPIFQYWTERLLLVAVVLFYVIMRWGKGGGLAIGLLIRNRFLIAHPIGVARMPYSLQRDNRKSPFQNSFVSGEMGFPFLSENLNLQIGSCQAAAPVSTEPHFPVHGLYSRTSNVGKRVLFVPVGTLLAVFSFLLCTAGTVCPGNILLLLGFGLHFVIFFFRSWWPLEADAIL